MWKWGNILDGEDFQSARLYRPDRRLTAGSRTFDPEVDLGDSHLLGNRSTVLSCSLSRKGSRFTTSLVSNRSTTLTHQSISLSIREGDDGVIEGRFDVNDSAAYVPPNLFLRCLRQFKVSDSRGYFFFFATVLAGPLRVLALVRVFCPRTGSPRR